MDSSVCRISCAQPISFHDHASGLLCEPGCEVGYFTLWDVTPGGFEQYISEDSLSSVTGGRGRDVAERAFGFQSESVPVCFPVIGVSARARRWWFVEPTVEVDYDGEAV